jgi:hypothetical protein
MMRRADIRSSTALRLIQDKSEEGTNHLPLIDTLTKEASKGEFYVPIPIKMS